MLAGFAVLFASFITFFRTINNFPLRNWDEAWYAEIIKNMAAGTHSLLVPFWNGRYYFDKPPLYFWLSLPFFKIFGPGEWQARIISALAAVGATVLVYLITKKLFDKTTGLISSSIFLTMGQVVIRFAHGNLDTLLVALILLTFYLFLLSAKKPIFSVLSGISLGAVALTKGWILGLFPTLLILTYSLFVYRKFAKNFLIIAVFALLSSMWYFALGTAEFGKSFIASYILNPSAGLLNSPLTSFSVSYFKDLVRDIGFWFALPLIFATRIKKIDASDKKILTAFALTSLIFIFSLNFLSEKLGWYNLPAYPLIAIIIGYFASKLWEKSQKLTVFIIIFILAAQIININRIENIYPDRSKIGATLGQHAGKIIPKEDTIILDDHDLTSFLYYSKHGEIFVSQETPGKDWEWWIKTYIQIPDFAKQRGKTWIITKNPEDFSKIPVRSVSESNGYTFLLTTF